MKKITNIKFESLSINEMCKINGGLDDRPLGRPNYDSPTPSGSGSDSGSGSNNTGWMYLLWYAMGQAMS